MSASQPKLSEVIDVRAESPEPTKGPSSTLAKSATLEVRRLTLAKGREIPTHQAKGEISVHCLEGRIAFTSGAETRELGPNQMIILAAAEPHSLVSLDDATVLVTKVLPPTAPTS